MAIYLRCNNCHLFCDVLMFVINVTEMCNGATNLVLPLFVLIKALEP